MTFNVPDKYAHRSGIYIIRSTISADCYIGRTNNFWQRYMSHKSGVLTIRCVQPKLRAFVVKHGADSLCFEILKRARVKLVEKESKYIRKLKPSLNMVHMSTDTK